MGAKDYCDEFAKEFLNMIQKNCQNLDVRVIWKDNWHYWALKNGCLFF